MKPNPTTFRNRRKKAKCFCWCMTELVLVTPAEVLNGITHSCGRKGCNENHPLLRRKP